MIETRKVYLSSTLKDLEEERAAVREALRDRCLVIESYSANEETVRDGCLNELAKCDLYVGILGFRYGHCPDGGRLSITELEFDKAVELKLPQLIFIKNGKVNADWIDALTEEKPPERIQAFRKKIKSRVVEFSNAADLKFHVLNAYDKHVERQKGEKASASNPPQPLVASPEGATELQTMLSLTLMEHWSTWPGRSNLLGARVFLASETIKAQALGLPCDIFRAAVGDQPSDVLSRLDGFVRGESDAASKAAAFRADPILREMVLLIALVSAERYIQIKREKDQKCLHDEMVLASADVRLCCVLAAASFGFGIKLEFGHPFPRNFAKAPAAELGYEDLRKVIALELFAQAKRMKGGEFQREMLDAATFDKDLLISEMKEIRAKFGCSLVLRDHCQGALSQPALRHSLREELGVPSVLFSEAAMPKGDADWLLKNLKLSLGELLEVALGPSSPSQANAD